MSDLQISPGGKEDKYSSPHSMKAMIVAKGDELEGVIHVDVEEVDAFYNAAWKRFGSQLKVPGYRPGKAPRAMLERQHGRRMQELVTTSLMDDFYKRSVKRIPGPILGGPRFFYDKPATFGEPFKFSFVIPKPEGFSQEGDSGDMLTGDDSENLYEQLTGDGVLTSNFMDLDDFIKTIEPPDLSKLSLTRVNIGISDQELEERFDEYRHDRKTSDEEIAQHLGLSSATELPNYFKNELREERSLLTKVLLHEQVKALVTGNSSIYFNGQRMKLTKAAEIFKEKLDGKDRKEFLLFATTAVFFKVAELEGMDKEIADTKNETILIDELITSVTERVIEKAIIKELHFESWAKAEESIRRSVNQ